MWTSENRGSYDRGKLRYPSDVTEGALEIPCHFFKLKKRNDTCEMTLILRPPFLPCKTART
jgi:hypothetical protein